MAMIDEIPWHELASPGVPGAGELVVVSTHPFTRELETRLRRELYRWNHVRVDMVVRPWLDFGKVIKHGLGPPDRREHPGPGWGQWSRATPTTISSSTPRTSRSSGSRRSGSTRRRRRRSRPGPTSASTASSASGCRAGTASRATSSPSASGTTSSSSGAPSRSYGPHRPARAPPRDRQAIRGGPDGRARHPRGEGPARL